MSSAANPPPRRVGIGLVQMQMGDDVAANREKALRMTREAAGRGAEVVCLPELFSSRYFCQSEDTGAFALAEPVPGPTTQAFEQLARELDIAVVVSVFERRAAGLYHNTAAVVDRGRGYVGKYRKMHIPDDPHYFEKFYFAPGDLGFRSFATEKANLGVLVCWDQWYPEAARLTALQGAEILFYPTAIGWHPEEKLELGEAQHEAWELTQRAHAVANGCFVVAVNRTGFEPDASGGQGIEFWGRSFIAAPDGSVMCRAPTDSEAAIVETLELGQIETQRHGWPFFRDRRIDAYAGLSKRFDDA
ncbi:MAG: carbon-nitrogen hydrolase [Gammaproteobacteria bacterium]